jgi:glucose/mannose-6-phosphate isomerase
MLDDLKMIHQRDKCDALGLAAKQWQELTQVYDITVPAGDYRNVVLAGMGGSALAAELSKSWPGWKVPFEICRSYSAPSYVNENTLFIASSYSGNTEETISAMSDAEQRGATIVVMASGGKMVEIAKSKGFVLAQLPVIDKPRYGVLNGFDALVTIGERAGLLNGQDNSKTLAGAADTLKTAIQQWIPTNPVDANLAKQLALELMGRSVVIYAGNLLYPAAYKWKISVNENAKNVAWCDAFSEFNHNEFLGWTSHPTEKPYGVVYLLSELEHPRIKKRFELTEKLLSGRWPSPIHVDVQGSTVLEQLLWAVALGDMVSIYLAILNGVDSIDPPGKDLIETFKKELG